MVTSRTEQNTVMTSQPNNVTVPAIMTSHYEADDFTHFEIVTDQQAIAVPIDDVIKQIPMIA